MNSVTLLEPDSYYHIYNRGNNGEDLFHEMMNYGYFLQLYAQHIGPVADTYAYCLMRNHFHFLVRVKSEEEAIDSNAFNRLGKPIKPSQAFSNLFNAYSKAINKRYDHTGSVFQKGFGRVKIRDDSYFEHLIFYIHFNPQKHGFADNFRGWKWSSYKALITRGKTQLKRDEVIGAFGSISEFEKFHQGMVDESRLCGLIEDDWD